VWAVDVNARALELCRRNAERNALPNVRVVSPDDVPPAVMFATIWSNPPIRIGKSALHDLLSTWLARLDAAGSASLVVQKHLGADSLQRWVIELGYRCDRVGSKAGFRLLTVRHGEAR
jgi:16S rRNA G1207 methylase RsmC